MTCVQGQATSGATAGESVRDETGSLHGMRIGLIAGTLGQGGAETQLWYILRALRAAGASPFVLCLTRGEHWEGRFRDEGIPVEWVGASGSRMVRVVAIARRLRRLRADVIQSQHFYANIYAGLAGRILHRPSIGAIRSDGLSEARAAGRLTGRWQFGLPTILAVNSRVGIRNLQQMGIPDSRLAWLPNVIDTETFHSRANGTDAGHAGPVTVAGVGRLVRVKRFDRFLRVIEAARAQSGVEVRAVIAGDGPERAALERLARELGLGGTHLEFAGRLQDVRDLLGRADMLLLTSDHEGTPNAVMEAMSCGLPVVSTPAGDAPYLLGNADEEGSGEPVRRGIVTRGWSEAELVRAVRRLSEDTALRKSMGSAARDWIARECCLQALPGRLATMYARAAERRVR